MKTSKADDQRRQQQAEQEVSHAQGTSSDSTETTSERSRRARDSAPGQVGEQGDHGPSMASQITSAPDDRRLLARGAYAALPKLIWMGSGTLAAASWLDCKVESSADSV